ncbi:MAG: NADH:ubiquinone oxidoreductase [Bacteroidetes bacterium]|nr:NADH:ubiquinone oxidoreductase [Bacteroidota bacterium]
MLEHIKTLYHQGRQFIPDVTVAKAPGIFRGRPVINNAKVNESDLVNICPLNAISANPVRLDLGKCSFCGECAKQFPEKINFTTDYKIAANERESLIIKEGDDAQVTINPIKVRKEIHHLFRRSLKLRQVSAGGDNSCEWELNAANNVQFDMSRFGIEFVASPRHADGIVITGPITKNMAEPLQICYDATPDPKIIVLVGTDAISGGIFADSPAIDRSFLDKYYIDLYIPGNPAHPLTIINGLLDLTRKMK